MSTIKKHYSEVFDIPLFNWEKCLEGQFHFMRLERSKTQDTSDIKAFYKLYDKYLDRYDLSSEHKRYVEAQKHLIELRLQYVETGNEFLLNYIAIAEIDVANLEPTKEGGMTIGQTITLLSKWMGQWIDKKKITLEEYKDLIQEYERSNKKN